MKRMTTATLLALLAMNTVASDFRDAVLGGTTKATESILKAGDSTLDETIRIADLTAEGLKDFISKNLASSVDASGKLGEAILRLAEISEPVLQLTSEGVALVIEKAASTAEQSTKVSDTILVELQPASEATSEKLVLLLEPSTEISFDILEELFDLISKGTESASDLSDAFYKAFEKPLEASSEATEKIFELLFEGTESGTKVSEAILGGENFDKAVELTGDGIMFTSKGISAALHFVTAATTGISGFFEANSEELKKAVERNDQDMLGLAREIVREAIVKEYKGGETLNMMFTDADIDMVVQLKLALQK